MRSKSKQDADNPCDLSEKLYDLLTRPGTEVTYLIFPDDNVV